MDLNQLRAQIDEVDDQLISLVTRRMDIAADIAAYKKEHNLPVLNAQREREKLQDVASKSRADVEGYMRVLYDLMFELSRAYQNRLLSRETPQLQAIKQAIAGTPQLFPRKARVMCQGVDGSYSTAACERLFAAPEILYVKSFDGVFNAVSSGLCDYGVIPIENSTMGSVKKVYDLMIEHNFYIVRSTRIKINHCLLANPGARLEDIREVYSHEQALGQCGTWLRAHNIQVHDCENTAIAAQRVAESGRMDVAAVSSARCAELYGLKNLASNIQDNGNNHTRFICIARKPEIYPGADKTTLMLVLPHRPGALYKILARFYALGINLLKLESRPIPDRDFEFMFYFDLETSIYSEEFVRIISELDSLCEELHYLGSYLEVV